MGLGKTVQSIAFLCHIAETYRELFIIKDKICYYLLVKLMLRELIYSCTEYDKVMFNIVKSYRCMGSIFGSVPVIYSS